jgi:hypothetical protein
MSAFDVLPSPLLLEGELAGGGLDCGWVVDIGLGFCTVGVMVVVGRVMLKELDRVEATKPRVCTAIFEDNFVVEALVEEEAEENVVPTVTVEEEVEEERGNVGAEETEEDVKVGCAPAAAAGAGMAVSVGKAVLVELLESVDVLIDR